MTWKLLFVAVMSVASGLNVPHVLSTTAATVAPSESLPQTSSLTGKNLVVLLPIAVKPWTGFCEDLLTILQKELGFTSTTERMEGNGILDEDGKWTGMMGRLVNKTADVAISDLVISPVRREAIDFTVPFISSGITILMNQADVGNMTSIEDLANQDRVKVISLRPGWLSAMEFVSQSNNTDVQKIFKKMVEGNATDPSFMQLPLNEVLGSLNAGGTALFLEQMSARHVVNNMCNLTTFGGLLNDIGFGIGLQKNSPYTDLFSQTITRLKDEGKIKELVEKHWVRNPSLECPSSA